MNDLLRILRHFPLLAGCSPADLKGLDGACRRRALGRGDPLYREGDPARSCFLIVQGELEQQGRMVDGRNGRVAVHGPGTLLEPRALIERTRRTDTCVARGRALVLELDRPAFEGLVRANNRFAFAVLEQTTGALAERLRHVTDALTAARTGGPLDREGGSVVDAAHAVLHGGSGADAAFGGVDLDQVRFEAQRPRDNRDG